ncbi:hypothetical protein RFI_16167 [Reticulomyxa filosa]|uniref:Exonuclease domain-containing protein n=1 Tax=Reticulomyxa filosa TaxID=46433 RepID=X6N431_RETFI|nr:hypothetical protein RFI_16167 [Reticulomyxa filosa]|eukprot:ETO21040.1 hypothetical protein RFI_16167 [Reticulomyxa filosa]
MTATLTLSYPPDPSPLLRKGCKRKHEEEGSEEQREKKRRRMNEEVATNALVTSEMADQEESINQDESNTKEQESYYQVFGEEAQTEIIIRHEILQKRGAPYINCKKFLKKKKNLKKKIKKKNLHNKGFCVLFAVDIGRNKLLVDRVVVVQIDGLDDNLVTRLMKLYEQKCPSQSNDNTRGIDNTNTNDNSNDNNDNKNNDNENEKNADEEKLQWTYHLQFPFFQPNQRCPMLLHLKSSHARNNHFSAFDLLAHVYLSSLKGLDKSIKADLEKYCTFSRYNGYRTNNARLHRLPSPTATLEYFPSDETSTSTATATTTTTTGTTTNSSHLTTNHSTQHTSNLSTSSDSKLKQTTQWKCTPWQLVPTSDVLFANGFPTESDSTYAHFRRFPSEDPSSPRHQHVLHMVSIDCEMVQTTFGIELAHIAVVDDTGKCIYNQYVKPCGPVINYNTQFRCIYMYMYIYMCIYFVVVIFFIKKKKKEWSGITEIELLTASKTLDDVYNDISQWISQETYIIGHGLENDLKALHVIHENVLDTSLLFPAGSACKHKLKYLASKYLHRDIQQSGNGHDPNEDALAALNLIQLKLTNGFSFGRPFDMRCSIFNVLKKCKINSMIIGPLPLIQKNQRAAVSVIYGKSNSDTFAKCFHQLTKTTDFNKTKLLWAYLQDEGYTDIASSQPMHPKTTPLGILTQQLLELYNSAKNNTVFVFVGGNKSSNHSVTKHSLFCFIILLLFGYSIHRIKKNFENLFQRTQNLYLFLFRKELYQFIKKFKTKCLNVNKF